MTYDKSTWGDGPWMTEPDRVEFEHAGLPCILKRNRYGVWCGYTAVPPGHPAYGAHYDDVTVEVHGGLTYGDFCNHDIEICHVPKPGDPDNVYWLGFDCGHAFDLSPSTLRYSSPYEGEVYRDVVYVRAETGRLADQLAAMKDMEAR